MEEPMILQTLEEKLRELLTSCEKLTRLEKRLLLDAYLNPGRNPEYLLKTPEIEKTLQKMKNDGIFLLSEEKKHRALYPIPLALLLKRFGNEQKMMEKKAISLINSINQWIKYPSMRSQKISLKSSRDSETILRWLFDLHGDDWQKVYCFGDYESFIQVMSPEIEKEWIKERTKKMRKASVVATQDGKWAQRIEKMSQSELRECLIDPKDFSGLFVMAFPEIQTSVMSSNDGCITFVHSKEIAHAYTKLINSQLASKEA